MTLAGRIKRAVIDRLRVAVPEPVSWVFGRSDVAFLINHEAREKSDGCRTSDRRRAPPRGPRAVEGNKNAALPPGGVSAPEDEWVLTKVPRIGDASDGALLLDLARRSTAGTTDARVSAKQTDAGRTSRRRPRDRLCCWPVSHEQDGPHAPPAVHFREAHD